MGGWPVTAQDWLAEWMEDLGRRGFVVFVKYDGERIGSSTRVWTVIASHPELKDQVFRSDLSDVWEAAAQVDQMIQSAEGS